MENLFERLSELVGKTRPDSARLLIHLIEDLGEQPVVDCIDDELCLYDFVGVGAKFFYYTEDGSFRMLQLCIATAQVKAGELQPYTGKLPFKISADDSRELVEKKLPGGTMSVKDYRYDTDLRPLVLTFHFNTPDPNSPGSGDERLTVVSVTYSLE